eukprot:FR736075.1.p2 GENE.FR736075.1~~FR736075.1.p2  ORF type:complete len:104 (-),score=2.66 FR736075.1:456-767(-)
MPIEPHIEPVPSGHVARLAVMGVRARTKNTSYKSEHKAVSPSSPFSSSMESSQKIVGGKVDLRTERGGLVSNERAKESQGAETDVIGSKYVTSANAVKHPKRV